MFPAHAGMNRDLAWSDATEVDYPRFMIDIDDIRVRYQQVSAFLDERGRRLFAANEALALGPGNRRGRSGGRRSS